MNHFLKTFTSVLLGAAALVALSTGCVREPASNNPNFDPDKNTVRTKFVLNINNKPGNSTKMTAEDAQANGSNSFRGMQDVHILAYNLTTSPSFPNAPKVGEGQNVTYGKFYFNPATAGSTLEDFNFGRLFDASDVTSTNQSRVMELSFPLETNVVVLYGKALNTKGAEYQGSVTASGNPANLASLMFPLTPRVNPSNKIPFTAGAYAFQSILSSVMIAGLVDEQHYWTTTGEAHVNNADDYLPTGNTNKQYKIWLPYKPEDALYKKISGANTGGEGIFKRVNGDDYSAGDTYERREGDPVSEETYRLRIGNCSWKMLGDMWWADKDGDGTTTWEEVRNTCDPYTGSHADEDILDFVPLLRTLGEAYYKLITISTRDEVLKDANNNPIWVDDSDHDKGYKIITYHELRAGSAAAVLRTMRDVDFILHKVLDAKPTTWGEVVAQMLAKEIHSRVVQYFSGEKDNMVYNSAAVIASNIAEYADNPNDPDDEYSQSGIATQFTNEYLQGTGDNAPLDGTLGFPMNIGFPMGAAYLEAETTPATPVSNVHYYFHADRFVFKEDIPAYAFGTDEKFNIFNYCYPAELMYYGNSPLRISKELHTSNQFPGTIEQWENEGEGTLWGADWKKYGSVGSETRSVAMVSHINYGSALLKSTITYESGLTVLKDNNSGIHPNEDDNEITVSGVNTGLVVTGIVIGGQPAAVTWDFTRMPDNEIDEEQSNEQTTVYKDVPSYAEVSFTDDNNGGYFTGLNFKQDQFGKMIYDKVALDDRFYVKDLTNDEIDSGVNTIYTLCWDNYNATVNALGQSDVYIALELQNKTGVDFWGETNMVRKDAIFYLVGKLSLDSIRTSGSGNYNTLNGSLGLRSQGGYYYYPPFNPNTGKTVEVPRVFMQDYMTTAKLVLKQDALKHAYMSVPDLRSNQVSLGVSVDLKWETGLSFEVEMGKLN